MLTANLPSMPPPKPQSIPPLLAHRPQSSVMTDNHPRPTQVALFDAPEAIRRLLSLTKRREGGVRHPLLRRIHHRLLWHRLPRAQLLTIVVWGVFVVRLVWRVSKAQEDQLMGVGEVISVVVQ